MTPDKLVRGKNSKNGMVSSGDWPGHVQKIRKTFIRLRDADLTLNYAKCEFEKARIECLGHVVGLERNTACGYKQIESISDIFQPGDKKV